MSRKQNWITVIYPMPLRPVHKGGCFVGKIVVLAYKFEMFKYTTIPFGLL